MEKNELAHTQSILVFLSLMVYVSGYQVGFGPISWLMISEVFPLHVKGSAIAAAAVLNFSTNAVMTQMQPEMIEVMGVAGLFSLYSVLSALSLLFVWLIVPETRGKTLEEISSELC